MYIYAPKKKGKVCTFLISCILTASEIISIYSTKKDAEGKKKTNDAISMQCINVSRMLR